MKLLILGGNGMAGHVLVDYFKKNAEYTVFYTTRNTLDSEGLVLEASDSFMVEKLVEAVRPEIIINATGVLNRKAEENKIAAYQINGLLPHVLRHTADKFGARLIHISTDCVFEGTRGHYREDDVTDGTSIYASTKALGEIQATGHLTIRTSIIGPEIRKQGIGLMQWFMQQKGPVTGYRRVFWNGVTTLELAKAVEFFMTRPISGLIHLFHPEPICKHDLLLLIKQIWDLKDITVVPVDVPVQDRSLVSIREDVSYPVPVYEQMLKELWAWMQ
ncbi:SDR family oxidoreductase [Paenibacillus kribbensis]|uniref:SDR family oxidoreductase n=1 Tax=Paenibacillus kribbensis TaxID=172713 RepID=UPI0008398DD3|nr:SDR family oxidoreductase [Paenibacillus kribbensis]